MKTMNINVKALLMTLVVLSIFLYAGISRLKIDTDIVDSLPKNDPVISDAQYLIKHHPIQDQIAIDIGMDHDNPDLLVEISQDVEKKLSESGLFRKIGMKELQTLFPELMFNIIERLPYLFTQKDLQEKIEPLLAPETIDHTLYDHSQKLLGMDGIGQAQFMANDPLGFKDIILGRLKALIPSGNSKIYKEKLISSDNRHLLLTAVPAGSGTDTRLARVLTDLIHTIDHDINQSLTGTGHRITLTPVGAFRAALDNETTVRNDSNKSFVYTIIGIVILLCCSFSRPLVGILAFIPALAGTITAFFAFSMFHHSISILVIGFGGAFISVAVDIGIPYLLFLDRPHQATGWSASLEIWSIGLIATLTSVVAFLVLVISKFPILIQLGQFSALGISFAYIFVYLVFPRIIIDIAPSRKEKTILSRVVEKLTLSGWKGLWIAGIFTFIMLFFAKPEFKVDFSRMNVVSKETLAAEKMMADVWGNVFDKVFLMTEGSSVEELQNMGDHISAKVDRDMGEGNISSAFVPSMIFPGNTQMKNNYEAWKSFWSKDKISALQRHLIDSGKKYGFRPEAFSQLITRLNQPLQVPESSPIPKSFYEFLGIMQNTNQHLFTQLITLNTGKNYNSHNFYHDYHSYGRIFDPKFFSNHFSLLLSSTFTKLMIFIMLSLFAILFLFFLDIQLTFIILLPIFFALICTLGTLNLIGHPLDVACFMLTIMGMGVDYSLFIVMAFQKYHDETHPSFQVIKTAAFMAASTTLVGFGMLCTGKHLILKSAGLTCTFGIGYSLIGAFIIIPPFLRKRYGQNPTEDNSGDMTTRVLRRYHGMSAYHRMFAKYKIKYDPMFGQLSDLFSGLKNIQSIVDIGTGYSVPACWCLEYFRNAYIFGIEPNKGRQNISTLAVKNQGTIVNGMAPDIPQINDPADLVLMIDILHYLNDHEMKKTFGNIRQIMAGTGQLILRTAIEDKRSFLYWIEEIKLKIKGHSTHYKSVDVIKAALKEQGFRIVKIEPSSKNGDMMWFVAALDNGSDV